jgi:hypothetical protein
LVLAITDIRPVLLAMLLAAVAVPATAQGPDNSTTLTELLRENRLESGRQLPSDLLAARLFGFAVDSDEREFVCAFQEVGDGRSAPKSHIVLFDRARKRWQHRDISAAVEPSNSITAIRRTRRYLYLDSHINPSAGRLVVISKDLRVVRGLNGWALTVLANDSVILQHNQVHFAPTHRLEISMFDPRSGRQKRIYPPEPVEPVRRDFIARVAEEYKQRGERWFADHNHHMDPELFDSALAEDVNADSAANTIGFRVRFGDPQNGNDPLSFSEHVLATCTRIDSIERVTCHERKD